MTSIEYWKSVKHHTYSDFDCVEWYLNEGRITGQEYMRDARQYLVGEEGGAAGGAWRHWLTVPSVVRLQEGRLRVQAENTAGRAVAEANVRVVEPASVKIAMPEVTKEEVITSSSTTSYSHTSHSSSSSTYVKKVFTSTSDGPAEASTRATSSHATSVISKVGDEPVVQMHGRHDTQFREEQGASPVIEDKSSFMKMTGSVVTDELSQERIVQGTLPSTTAPRVEVQPALTTRSPAIKKKTTPARFITPLQGLIVKEDDRVVFECVIDGYPEPTVSWSHNGGPVDPACQTSVCLNRVCLVVPRVGQVHSGRYTCSIDNEAGSSHCTCDLVVKKTQFPPVFCKRLQPAVLGVGERLALEVDVTGTPEPEVSWSRNGEALQPSDHVTIRQEGTRHSLIIQKGELGDSARYGVVASNPAGRAECLADIMVTELIMQKAPQMPGSILFADHAQQMQQNETPRSGRGLVKSITRAIEEVAVENDPPFPVSKKPFIVKPSLQPQPVPDQPFLPPEPLDNQSSVPIEEVYEVQQRKPPGKLKKAWPPPPSEEEIVSYRIDPSSEVFEKKVSSIISTFSEMESPQEPVPSKPKPLEKIWPPPSEFDRTEADFELQPEPEPQFGVVPSSQEELSSEPKLQFDTVVPYTQELQELLPEEAPQFEVASGDEEFQEMESFESGEVIMHEPVVAKDGYSAPANILPIPEVEEEPMEVETAGEECPIPETRDNVQYIEKEVEETSEMEVKRTYEESEYKIVETKVFRSEERDSTDQEEFQDPIPESQNYDELITNTLEKSPINELKQEESEIMRDIAMEDSSLVVSDRSYETKVDEDINVSGITSRSLSKTPARVVSEEEDEPEEVIPFEFVSETQHVESEVNVSEELDASVTVSEAPKAIDEQPPCQVSDYNASEEIITDVSHQLDEHQEKTTTNIFPMDDVATEIVNDTPQTEYNIIQSPEPVTFEIKTEYIDKEMPEIIPAFATVVEPIIEQAPVSEMMIDEPPITHEPGTVPGFQPSSANTPPKLNSFERHEESVSMSSSRIESQSYSSSSITKKSSTSSFPAADTAVPTSLPQSSQFGSYEQLRSGDEMSKPPRPPEAEEREVRRPRKTRESVKQLAMRLEDTIVPLSPDEVPGGIRMFPTPSPTKDLSQPFKKAKPEEKTIIEVEKKAEVIKKEEKPKQFPELEPFPFTIDERKPKERTQSVPPLSKPKKFVPGTFTDSEHESETDSSLSSSSKRLTLKKIEFKVPLKDKPLRTASVGRDPLPPSAFDVPPAFDGFMRPQVVKEEAKVPEKKAEDITIPLQSEKKKQPGLVTKFMKSAENFVHRATSTEPKSKVAEAKAPAVSPSALTTVKSKTVREEQSVWSKSYHEVSVKKPGVQEQVPECVPQRLPAKLGKQWPPPQEPRVFSPTADDIEFLKKIGSEEQDTVSYSASSQQSFMQSSSSEIVQSSQPQVSSTIGQSAQHVPFSPPMDDAFAVSQSPKPTTSLAVGLVSPPIDSAPAPSAATHAQAKSPAAAVFSSPPPPRVFSPVSTRLVSSSNEYLTSPTTQLVSGSPSQVLSPPPTVSWPPARAVSPDVGKLSSPVRTMSPVRMKSPQIRSKSPAAAASPPTRIMSTKAGTPQASPVLDEYVSQPVSMPPSTGFKRVAAPVGKQNYPAQRGPSESSKPSFPFASEPASGSTFIRETKSVSHASSFQQQTSAFRNVQQQTQDVPKESVLNRSLSLERPPVTEPVHVPTTSFEAPPVMWSSNVTVKEKRSSWPPPQPSLTSAFSEENMYSQSKKEFWKSQESKFSSSQTIVPKPSPVYKSVPKIQPVNVSSHTVKPVATAPTAQPAKEAPKQDTIGSYKPIPDLEPFPFSVPESKSEQPIRRQAASLRMPKKFIPGSFTESEYESDYDANFSPKWRPCASDSESLQYKKLNVSLRGGRSRSTFRGSSPPPPSQFDVPPPVGGPLRPTVPRALDSDSDVPGVSTRAASVPKHRPMSMDASNLNRSLGKPQKQNLKGSVPSIPSALASSTPPSYKPMRTQWPSHSLPKRQSNVVHVRNISYSTSAFSPVTPSLSTQYSAMSTPNLYQPITAHDTQKPKAKIIDSVPSHSKGAVKIANSDTFDSSYKKVSTQSHTIPQTIPQTSAEVKQTSPGTKKKQQQQHVNTNRQFELEDGGYIADTESTLPRRNIKAQSTSESVSSSFMKKESHTSSSTLKTERKSYSSSSMSRETQQQAAFPAAFPGFGETSSAAVFQTSIPSSFTSRGTNPFPQAFAPASSVSQSTQQQSSSFFSSESKSSQVKKLWSMSQ
ncbi:Immunoglobulin I-set [Trinorchestia longiramus]|nr:Immunoglobulin I-set [Trinorchestia longiramus]